MTMYVAVGVKMHNESSALRSMDITKETFQPDNSSVIRPKHRDLLRVKHTDGDMITSLSQKSSTEDSSRNITNGNPHADQLSKTHICKNTLCPRARHFKGGDVASLKNEKVKNPDKLSPPDSGDDTDSALGDDWREEVQSLVDNIMEPSPWQWNRDDYSSAMVNGSHDLSYDSSSGIESGEAAQSDTSPNNNRKSGSGRQIQHKALIHKGGERTSQQPLQRRTQLSASGGYVHNRDLSWSSQTCSDSDIIQGGSLFSSSDTDNNTGIYHKLPHAQGIHNTRTKTPFGVHNKKGHAIAQMITQDKNAQHKLIGETVNGHVKVQPKDSFVNKGKSLSFHENGDGGNKVRARASKCKKHVTFQQSQGLNQRGDFKDDRRRLEESNRMYEGGNVQYQYYNNSTKQTVYHETDLDNPNSTVTVRQVNSHHHPSSNMKSRSLSFTEKKSGRSGESVSQSYSLPQQDIHHQSKHSHTGSYLDVLPDDVIIRIFSHLQSDQICQCSGVCRKWYTLAWSPQLWTSINISNAKVNVDKALKHLTKRLSYNTPGLCILVERIQLNGCVQLTDKGLFTIAKRCSELRQLEIQGCVNVSNIAMFEVVSRCVNLEHLNVTGCEMVTCISLTPQATVQAQTYGKQVDLRYLDMSDCYNLEDAGLQIIASYCSQLVYLYLRRCSKVTDIGVQYVANYCHDLKELSISDCNKLTDFGMKELAKLGSKLRYLSVAKCEQVTDVGVKCIARYCHRIRYLNVRGCEGVTDESVQYLSRQCQRLRSLDIGKCDVTDEGLQALASNSPQLKKLSLKSCDAITDKGIGYIAEKCPLLQQLNIQECSVTVTGYRKVKSLCKNCIIEHTNPGFY